MERTLTDIKCPDCHGPIWEERQDKIIEYRCRVGHAYSPLSLTKEQEEATERSLWETMVSLEDTAETAERLAVEMGPQYLEEAQRKRAQAAEIRKMLRTRTRPTDNYVGGSFQPRPKRAFVSIPPRLIRHPMSRGQ